MRSWYDLRRWREAFAMDLNAASIEEAEGDAVFLIVVAQTRGPFAFSETRKFEG